MAAILAYVARFAREHGGEGAPPPPEDLWWGEPEYHALLEALKAAATAVELVEHIPNERIQRGGARGDRLFFDSQQSRPPPPNLQRRRRESGVKR